jgi:hypothetical protein
VWKKGRTSAFSEEENVRGKNTFIERGKTKRFANSKRKCICTFMKFNLVRKRS